MLNGPDKAVSDAKFGFACRNRKAKRKITKSNKNVLAHPE